MAELAAFRLLRTDLGQEVLGSLDGYDPEGVFQAAERLRRSYDPGLVAAAMTQARLRARAAAKFGADAHRMFFTPDGLEQATRAAVADHRAGRYAAAGIASVADLCCGIGGDSLALARAGLRVRAVDSSPLACAVAAANAAALGLDDRIEVVCADVTAVDLAGSESAFLDPARRTASRRVFDPDAYAPPFSFVAELAARVTAVGVKAAPGLPHEHLPPGAEAEWVSDRGELKETALWFGPLASAERRATLLPGAHTLARPAGAGAPPTAPVGEVGRYLYEPDAAVIRAGLVAETAHAVEGRLLDPTIAYLTADAPRATPFAVLYEIEDVMPFQLKRLRSALRARGIGPLTVKKRGSALDPATLRRQLRLAGPHAGTIVLTRVAGAPTVLVVRQVFGGVSP